MQVDNPTSPPPNLPHFPHLLDHGRYFSNEKHITLIMRLEPLCN